MNFTREPIIETIISPKEGFKLLVRNSKGENAEEYYVDAVEVVSFGHAFFFRSMERPKAFLVPVSDYEVLEVKEARVALKNVSHEKSIKIGGGREAPMRPVQREPREQPSEDVPAAAEDTALETAVESRMDRKRDRRRHRRRRGGGGHEDREHNAEQKPQEQRDAEAPKAEFAEEEIKSASLFSSLIPPPPTLISETLSRYREKEAQENSKENDTHKEHTSEAPPARHEPEEDSGADSQPLHRISTKENSVHEVMNATFFTPLPGGGDPFF